MSTAIDQHTPLDAASNAASEPAGAAPASNNGTSASATNSDPSKSSDPEQRSAGRLLPQPLVQSRMMRLYDQIEAFVSQLSVRDTFWHRVCSLIWLPYAFFSGIRMREIEANVYAAVLPFTRFNRNWYRAMAGGALLANSEIAGGMFVFGQCGGDYTVVCKHLDYTFMRPCLGPAIYKMTARESIRDNVKHGGEFNITLDMEILQQVTEPGLKDKRVGRCEATFHITPKIHHKLKKARKAGTRVK